MSAQITYLSTTVTIGGNTIALKTDPFPDLTIEADAAAKAAADAVTDAIAKEKARAKARAEVLKKRFTSFTFKMDPGQVISVSIQQIIDWVNSMTQSASDVSKFNLNFLKGMIGDTTVFEHVTVNLWKLSITTKGHLSFNIQVALDKDIYNELGVPEIVQKVFTVDSIGIGISYQVS